MMFLGLVFCGVWPSPWPGLEHVRTVLGLRLGARYYGHGTGGIVNITDTTRLPRAAECNLHLESVVDSGVTGLPSKVARSQ